MHAHITFDLLQLTIMFQFRDPVCLLCCVLHIFMPLQHSLHRAREASMMAIGQMTAGGLFFSLSLFFIFTRQKSLR